VQVLNDSFWPISGVDKFPIPGKSSEFVACISKFEEYYKAETGMWLISFVLVARWIASALCRRAFC
jgi:hypothetical protein